MCFNSLQTGKCIQRPWPWTRNFPNPEFQFPSNGKVYPKARTVMYSVVGYLVFQFPSNGKVYPKRVLLVLSWPWRNSFQFPSNGKVYPKFFSARPSVGCLCRRVSIPFKRESVSKDLKNEINTVNGIMFQFPSNGKVYPKFPYFDVQHHPYAKVSIPFKRESVSKAA